MKLNNLQILRGISALLVCCFHLREGLETHGTEWGEILFSKGSIGVPVFFIISGFIMVFTTKKINFGDNMSGEVVSFYKKRIIRIVPLYFLLTFAWIILGGSASYYMKGEGLERLIHSLLFLPQNDTFPVLYLGWSLNHEMFFYLIFGLSLFFRQHRYLFIIGFFILSAVTGMLLAPENAFLKMITSHLNLYFVVGIAFGLYLNKFQISKPAAVLISATGIPLFLLMILNIIPVPYKMLVLMIVSLLVLSFLTFDCVFKFRGNRFLIYLGDISYSLYLSHTFVGVLAGKIPVDGYFIIPYFILKLVIIIILSSLLYYSVEKKVTDYLKLKLKA